MDFGVWPLMKAAWGQGPLMGCPLSHPRAVLAEGPAQAEPRDNYQGTDRQLHFLVCKERKVWEAGSGEWGELALAR